MMLLASAHKYPPRDLAKRKRPAIDGASSGAGGVGDDTIGTILARLPARTVIACTALSKHHRSLIRSPEFRSLHCRLGAPLPSPLLVNETGPHVSGLFWIYIWHQQFLVYDN